MTARDTCRDAVKSGAMTIASGTAAAPDPAMAEPMPKRRAASGRGREHRARPTGLDDRQPPSSGRRWSSTDA